MMTLYDLWANVWASAFPGYFITAHQDLFNLLNLFCTVATVYVCVKYFGKLVKSLCGRKEK